MFHRPPSNGRRRHPARPRTYLQLGAPRRKSAGAPFAAAVRGDSRRIYRGAELARCDAEIKVDAPPTRLQTASFVQARAVYVLCTPSMRRRAAGGHVWQRVEATGQRSAPPLRLDSSARQPANGKISV